MKEKYGFSIYKFLRSGRTMLEYRDSFYELGNITGEGSGAVSVALADMNNDGISELYYTGSGTKGFSILEAGYFDPAKGELTSFTIDWDTQAGFWGKELMLTVEDGRLEVYSASAVSGETKADITLTPENKAGEIVYESGEIIFKTAE